jgi:hypothetical protein
MLATYPALGHLALSEFKDVVIGSVLLGGPSSSPNKLRLLLADDSFLDIWLTLRVTTPFAG